MLCSTKFKKYTGYLHGIAIAVIAIFSGIQISDIQKGKDSGYWVPLGICIMMALRLPNIICIALGDSHGWYVVIGSIIALVTNAYIAHMLLKASK